MNVPRTLSFNGRTINFAGRGRVTGSHAYLDLANGKSLDLFAGTVVQTGPIYSLIEIHDNKAMPAVRIDHAAFNGSGPPRNGDILLCGPVAYKPSGPRANHAWQLKAARPKVKRLRGVIGQIAPVGTYGRIIDPQGRLVFVHRNSCRNGAFRLGQKVSFVLTDDGRGPKAVDVAAA